MHWQKIKIIKWDCYFCCTWTASCNIRRHYVARGPRLATFGDIMLHVNRVLQHSETLCCTWTASCNIRRHYVARAPRLATFTIKKRGCDINTSLSLFYYNGSSWLDWKCAYIKLFPILVILAGLGLRNLFIKMRFLSHSLFNLSNFKFTVHIR